MRRIPWWLLALVFTVACGVGGPPAPIVRLDGGSPGGDDLPGDAGAETGLQDVPSDLVPDAGEDGPAEVLSDSSQDLPPDAPGEVFLELPGDAQGDTVADAQEDHASGDTAPDLPPPPCGSDAECDDANPCTDDACLLPEGCVHTPNGDPCDDGDPCTLTDLCQEGDCFGGDNVCPCSGDAACLSLEDGDPCNGLVACIDGVCQVDPATVPVCTDPEAGDCAGLACDPAIAACAPVPLEDGAPCDDGDACTPADACFEGACVPGPALDCADEDLCTLDTCDPGPGTCDHVTMICDDGLCGTADVCNPALGECVFWPIDCDDGEACTTDIVCACGGAPAGWCLPGQPCANVPVTCTDSDPCTTDGCDPATGLCPFTPLDCGDGNACTADACIGGDCVHPPLGCNDGNACTADGCHPATGCTHAAVGCNDGNACTLDGCHPATGCTHVAVGCDDGDACTVDGCHPASGCTHVAAGCDDGDACSVDGCDPATGCTYLPVACTDKNPCTDDLCDPTSGCFFPPASCGDGNPCTDDGCDPGTGCTHLPNGDLCDDGDACTAGDLCFQGTCGGPVPVDCDDGNPCTDDGCDPHVGCTNEPNGDPCDDGDACTVKDVCDNGLCAGPILLDCDDGNPCTDDSCVPASGCLHDSLGGIPCDDGSACTVGDACVAGQCIPGDDACAPCAGKLDGDACNDGDGLTLGDMCVAGACAGWTRAEFEPRAQSTTSSLVDVTWSSGRFFAAGTDQAASGPDPKTWAWIVTLEDGGVSVYHAGSQRSDTSWVALGNDLAVGTNGKASFFDTVWAQDPSLEALLAQGTVFGTIRDLWGGRFQDVGAGKPRVDRYWLVGRNTSNTLGFSRLCTRTAPVSGPTAWECAVMPLDTYAEYELPAAVDATLAPVPGGWQLQRAYLVSDAVSWLGDPTTYWLDVFASSGLTSWGFLGYLADPYPHGRNWDDVVARDGTTAWAVGSRGLVARVNGDQVVPVESPAGSSLALADWTSASFLGDLLVVTGIHTQDVSTPTGIQRTRTFLVLTHRGEAVGSGWVSHSLGSVVTTCTAGLACDAIVAGNRLIESTTRGGEAYLVGHGWSGAPGNPKVKALVFHMDVPTL
ncbi:MAG: hypothetical protein FJ098_00405 [Deltaproteobacteria bacterium]|nr:hypothetical protein [Deltaproteobacteria bacterium]